MPSLFVLGRKLLLSPADLLLPFLCGVILHSFFVIALIITALYLEESSSCGSSDSYILSWFLYAVIACHALIVIVNILCIAMGQNLSILQQSLWLPRILTFRVILNVADIGIAAFGIYILVADDLDCFEYSMRALVMAVVIINWSILIISCCGVCCISATEHEIRHHPEASLKKLCCSCFWEGSAWNNGNIGNAFSDMGGLLEILRTTEHLNSDEVEHLAPSDIVVGLQLYRMLQKHYGQHDDGFFQPFASEEYQHKVECQSVINLSVFYMTPYL